MPFATARLVDIGHARARATRISYVGGPGYELCVPTDQCITLYDALWREGAPFGLSDAGYYTIDALRIEAGRRAWGAELSPDDTPLEAGLGYAVALDKPEFIGRDALLRQRERGLSKRLVQFTLDDPAAFAWGGEPVLMDGRPVGELTSTGYSRKLGRDGGIRLCEISPARYCVDRRNDPRGALRDRHRRDSLRGDGPSSGAASDDGRRRSAFPLASQSTRHGIFVTQSAIVAHHGCRNTRRRACRARLAPARAPRGDPDRLAARRRA